MHIGMLGNSEALRQVWDGPLKDLIIKMNGENGPEVLEELKKFNRQEPCWVSKQERVEIVEPQVIIPNLRTTGPPLADWLKAREELHRFFTGETIVLRDLFVLTDEELASTTLMPAFRPVGATNLQAVEWKRRMGVQVFVEDEAKGGVMRYRNSRGPKKPELYLINRSVTSDAGTLGDNAKSPDGLLTVPNNLWLELYGWCDADTLHFAIATEHLDPKTWCWFPNDRLPDGDEVARGSSNGGGVGLRWNYRSSCNPDCGARSAKQVPLRT